MEPPNGRGYVCFVQRIMYERFKPNLDVKLLLCYGGFSSTLGSYTKVTLMKYYFNYLTQMQSKH